MSREPKGMFSRVAIFTAALLGLLLPSAAYGNSQAFDVANQQLSFIAPNPPNTSEVLAGADPTTPAFRYSNIITVSGTQIDALISIVYLQNSESDRGLADDKIDRVDANDTNPLLETRFGNSAPRPQLGFAVYDVNFVLGGTSTPVILRNVVVTVRDVDNDQFVEFSGLSSYTLASGRDTSLEIGAYTGNAQFTAINRDGTLEQLTATVPDGSVMFFATWSSSSSDPIVDQEKFWVEANFGDVSTLRVKLGSYDDGFANFDLDFRTAGFTGPTDPPVQVNQPSFTLSYDANTGSGTVPNSTSGNGQLPVASASVSEAMTKAGSVFAGWNTRADGSGVTYNSGSSILLVADTTLFAMWTASPEPAVQPELAKTGLGFPTTLGVLAAGAMLLVGFSALRRGRRAA